jgi:hypothetical protein
VNVKSSGKGRDDLMLDPGGFAAAAPRRSEHTDAAEVAMWRAQRCVYWPAA